MNLIDKTKQLCLFKYDRIFHSAPLLLTARPWAEAVLNLPVVFFNRAAMGRERFMFYPGFFFNRAAIGRRGS